MEKQSLSPIEMLKIAAQHAYAAEHLLKQNGEVPIDGQLKSDALLPIVSMMHLALEITLKAFLLHEQGKIRKHKNLMELTESNAQLNLSAQDKEIIQTLSRQYAFRKGLDFDLWENRQQLQVFCERTVTLYERLLKMIPLELQENYQA